MSIFEVLGLEAIDEAVYRTMLAHREWGVKQIAEHLDLARPQIKATLDRLSELALLTPSSACPDGLRPVRPAVGLSALLARAEADALHRRQQIDATRAAIAAIATEHATVDERDDSTTYEGIDAVRERLEELTDTAVRECLSLNPNFTQTTQAKQASRPLNEQMLNRGVAVRCVYQDSFRNDPSLVEYARWLTALGGQVRTVPVLPMLMVVYDRATVLVPLDPNVTATGALEIRSAGIVALACALFEQIWSTATPFGQVAPRDNASLDATQRQLLLLLAAGHTDEVAARRLGVSLSTVRRLMATLMERLDARSRFQAGIHAKERGWLPLAQADELLAEQTTSAAD